MNALLLSAGVGERLMPLTLYRPKCLLPATSEGTMLKYWYKTLTFVGIHNIYVNIFWLKDQIIKYRHKSIDKKARIFAYEEDSLEPVEEVLWGLRNHLGDNFLVINSDTFILKNKVDAFVTHAMTSPDYPVCIGVSMQDNVFGKSLVTVDKKIVTSFIEKPVVTIPYKGYVYAGIMMMNKSVINKDKGFMSKLIPELRCKMTAIDVGNIVDIGGSVESYLRAYENILEMERTNV